MSQVVVTRVIHGSFAFPTSGSVTNQVEKLRPDCFPSKVLLGNEQKSRLVFRSSWPITAKRSAKAEPLVIPVSPEDVPKVIVRLPLFFNVLCFGTLNCWLLSSLTR